MPQLDQVYIQALLFAPRIESPQGEDSTVCRMSLGCVCPQVGTASQMRWLAWYGTWHWTLAQHVSGNVPVPVGLSGVRMVARRPGWLSLEWCRGATIDHQEAFPTCPVWEVAEVAVLGNPAYMTCLA